MWHWSKLVLPHFLVIFCFMAQRYSKVHSLLNVGKKIQETELFRCLSQQNLLSVCDLPSMLPVKVGTWINTRLIVMTPLPRVI